VRGSDHNPATASKETHRVGKLRRGSVAVQENDLKAVGNHDRSAKFGKVARAMSGIVSDRAGEISGVGLPQDVIGQALCTLADGSIVDGIRADRVHSATPAPGSKGDDGPKCVIEFFPICSLNMGQELWSVLGVARLAEPIRDILGR